MSPKKSATQFFFNLPRQHENPSWLGAFCRQIGDPLHPICLSIFSNQILHKHLIRSHNGGNVCQLHPQNNSQEDSMHWNIRKVSNESTLLFSHLFYPTFYQLLGKFLFKFVASWCFHPFWIRSFLPAEKWTLEYGSDWRLVMPGWISAPVDRHFGIVSKNLHAYAIFSKITHQPRKTTTNHKKLQKSAKNIILHQKINSHTKKSTTFPTFLVQPINSGHQSFDVHVSQLF